MSLIFSAPTITPCGVEPYPNLICCVLTEIESSSPNSPDRCAVYKIDPLPPGATSCDEIVEGLGILLSKPLNRFVQIRYPEKFERQRLIPQIRTIYL